MPHYTDYDYQEVPLTRIRAYAAFGPFRVLTILMMAVTVLLLCVCVACGLMYVADLAEEYPTGARTMLRYLILANLLIHGAIMLVDHLSWWRSCVSIAVNLLYLRIMRTFPFIHSLNDPLLCVTILLTLTESAMWYWLSVRLMYYTSFFTILAFFVYLWLVPLGLLASCVLEEERLPGLGAMGGTAHGAAQGFSRDGGPKRKTMLNRFVEFLKPPQ